MMPHLRSFSRFLHLYESHSGPVSVPYETAEPSSYRVSTRYPTAKQGGELHPEAHKALMSHSLQIGLEHVKEKDFEHNADVMRGYKVLHHKTNEAPHHELVEHLVNHFKGNLLHLHDSISEEKRNRAKKWYDGAHRIAKDRAQKYGVPHHVAAGVYAVLSPQNPWHANVSHGDRVMDIYHHHQDHHWSNAMEETGRRIWGSGVQQQLHNEIRGKRLSDLTDPVHKAAWIRTYDEAHNPRHHHIVTPEGEVSDRTNHFTAWKSNDSIAKAVNMIETGGHLEHMTHILGAYHKVRSFYNNIVDPNGHHGDVTIDTHAVAAAHLKPFGASAAEVHHSFGTSPERKKQPEGWVPARNGTAMNGVKGLYGVYAESYRRAASERGIKPREMQSITWEGVRNLFPEHMKKKGNKSVAKIHEIWHNHHQGTINTIEARNQIDAVTGGVKNDKFDWG